MKLIVISGRSGSGKSVILQTLEDLHYYCVDNIPPVLLLDLLKELEGHHPAVAVSLDARNLIKSDADLSLILNQLKEKYNASVIYLDADDATLLKRFKETRRRHPLTSQAISLKEALANETALLAPLAEIADLKIHTSQLATPQLRNLTISYLHQEKENQLSILLESFGYKYAIPLEADLIFDARCLPNPYWEKTLRDKSGNDKEVIEFLDQQPLCHDMLSDIHLFLVKWLPVYQAEHRKYLTVAIGCTGGHHRSVYLVNKLAEFLKNSEHSITVRHRDLS